MLAFLRRTAVALAWLYPAALLVVVLAFRWLGEDWWFTAAALYLPRAGFGLPLLVLLPAALLLRVFRALWPLSLATLLVLWPLMGLTLASPSGRHDAKGLKVLSLNGNSCASGTATIVAAISQHDPDIALFQEVRSGRSQLAAALRSRFASVHAATEFVLASRFPILEVSDPDRGQATERPARYLRYVLQTPLGPVTVFNMHPASPRAGLNEIRGPEGFRHELWSGRAFSRRAAPETEALTELRREEVTALALDVSDETNPVIVAGDSNLPTLSKLARLHFAGLEDGFSRVGFGFGYTYPARLPWMRIDRILVGSALRFTSFEVGCRGASDHLCVVAQLTRR